MVSRKKLLASLVREIQVAKGPLPLVVGISGSYTSGKTRLTAKLAAALRNAGQPTVVIHYDDFHHPLNELKALGQSEVDTYYLHAFDPEKLVQEVLAPLADRHALHQTLHVRDWGKDDNSKPLRLDITKHTVVLVEGMLLFRQPVLDYLDLRVFLTVSDAEIMKRARLRDVPKFGAGILRLYKRRYLPVYHRYLEADHPAAGAIVIDNDHPEAPVIRK